jgi:hypothetical protein
MANRSVRRLDQSPLFGGPAWTAKVRLDQRRDEQIECALHELGYRASKVFSINVVERKLWFFHKPPKQMLVSEEVYKRISVEAEPSQPGLIYQLVKLVFQPLRRPIRAILRARGSQWTC